MLPVTSPISGPYSCSTELSLAGSVCHTHYTDRHTGTHTQGDSGTRHLRGPPPTPRPGQLGVEEEGRLFLLFFPSPQPSTVALYRASG